MGVNWGPLRTDLFYGQCEYEDYEKLSMMVEDCYDVVRLLDRVFPKVIIGINGWARGYTKRMNFE